MTHTKPPRTVEDIQARIDLIKTRKELHPYQILLSRWDDWKTPHTYTERYDKPENKPGIYCFVGFKTNDVNGTGTLLYIGSSKILKTRYSSHNMRQFFKGTEYDYIQFYFRYCDNHIEIESKLIREFMPLFNSRMDG